MNTLEEIDEGNDCPEPELETFKERPLSCVPKMRPWEIVVFWLLMAFVVVCYALSVAGVW